MLTRFLTDDDVAITAKCRDGLPSAIKLAMPNLMCISNSFSDLDGTLAPENLRVSATVPVSPIVLVHLTNQEFFA